MTIEQTYDLWAEQYDDGPNKTRDLDARSTMETLEKYEFSRVIELGCGTGKNTPYLLQKADRVISLDFSYEMLKIAREKIQNEGVKFRKVDLTEDWKIEDEFADLITSSLVLEHIENLDIIFRQAYQKLKENGLFYISELHPFKQYAGSKARFETDTGTHELETYIHHMSEYFKVAAENKFSMLELKEYFDEENKEAVPRLINIVLVK